MFATALPLGMAMVINARHIYGIEEHKTRLSLGYLELMAACHIVGAIVYVAQVSTSNLCDCPEDPVLGLVRSSLDYIQLKTCLLGPREMVPYPF